MKKQIRVASLFSGIGGFEVGLFEAFGKERVDVVFSSEIDTHANRAYEALYGNETAGDITRIHEKDVPDHDVLVGGFPCQAFSISGRRRGFEDTRGTLFFDIARIAKEKQPKWMMLENVKGLISHDGGKTLQTIVKTLSELDYAVDFQLLNSKYFGVPQNRERLYIVASRDEEKADWKRQKDHRAVTQAKDSLQGLVGVKTFNFPFPKQTHANVSMKDIMESEVEEKYYLTKERLQTYVRKEQSGEHQTAVTDKRLRQIGYIGKNAQGNRVYHVDGVGPTVASQTGGLGGSGGGVFLVEEKEKSTDCRIRKLTTRECLAMQGFPPDTHDRLLEAGIPHSQLYKMAGNAVTTNVVAAVASKMKMFF